MKNSSLKTQTSVATFLFGKAFTVIIVFVVLLWLYIPSLDFHFFLDDYGLLHSGHVDSVSGFFRSFHPVRLGVDEFVPFYRPLSQVIYFWLMQLIVGWNPLYYHFIGLVMLGLISFTVYLITTHLSEDALAGFFGAILFAVCTTHGITQLWISLTQDLIVVFLMATSFYVYLLSLQKGKALHRAASAALFVLALLSMEHAIILPGLLLLVELVYSRPKDMEETKRLVARLLPFALIALAYLVFRMAYIDLPRSGSYKVAIGLFALRNLGRYLLIASNSFLAGVLGVPSMDTLLKGGADQGGSWGVAWVKFSVVVIGMTWLAWRYQWRLKREALFALGWFGISMLPVLFLPHHFYLYYLLSASVGFVFLVARWLSSAVGTLNARSRPLGLTVCLVWLGASLVHSTVVVRGEQAALRVVSLSMYSIEEQLLHQVPHPADGSGFVFMGNYGFGWWRHLSPAIRVIYGNPTLNATTLENGQIPDYVMKSPDPIYLVNVRDGIVSVTTLNRNPSRH